MADTVPDTTLTYHTLNLSAVDLKILVDALKTVESEYGLYGEEENLLERLEKLSGS